MSKTIELTDENFDQEISSKDVPVLVDYWAEWCGPCKMVAPILEEVAEDLDGKLLIGKKLDDKIEFNNQVIKIIKIL